MNDRTAAELPPDLEFDLRIRIWVYENVGPLFHELPEPTDDDAESPGERYRQSKFDRRMTAYSGTLEAVESLLELFPIRDLTKARNEQVRLFVNTRKGVPAPPYASWYIDGKLLGPSTEWVQERYREQGLDASGADEPVDFITTEFEFMEHLCRHELAARQTQDRQALQQVLDAQGHFVGEHLARWLPLFARAIRKGEPIPLFARLARILEVFAEEEAARSFSP
ncbi:MAG: molecular chaperone TorD family protein [Acidobacteriota bacterium]|nr:molecular chaperone TorD family protein [Acidobacteriota bacterium]MDQ7087535.1 molecular chaperone TorD family protein [Acidobacteriota bacterium]